MGRRAMVWMVGLLGLGLAFASAGCQQPRNNQQGEMQAGTGGSAGGTGGTGGATGGAMATGGSGGAQATGGSGGGLGPGGGQGG